MKRIRAVNIVSTLAFAALLGGCLNGDDDSLTTVSTDDAEDEAALEESIDVGIPGYADPDVFIYGDEAISASGRDEIETLHWWRELLNVHKTVEIEFSSGGGPRTASVSINKDLDGVLHLLARSDPTSPAVEIKKEFENSAVRSLYFERQGPPIVHPRRGWKLKAMSGALIESPETTRQIRSVRIQADGVDQTITNVSELVRLRDLTFVPPNSVVTVTVDTGDSNDAVFLHLKRHPERMQLASNDDGTFTGAFQTGKRPGPHHVVVDVLAHSTLFDDTARYDNVAWGVPYLIAGEDDGLNGN